MHPVKHILIYLYKPTGMMNHMSKGLQIRWEPGQNWPRQISENGMAVRALPTEKTNKNLLRT